MPPATESVRSAPPCVSPAAVTCHPAAPTPTQLSDYETGESIKAVFKHYRRRSATARSGRNSTIKASFVPPTASAGSWPSAVSEPSSPRPSCPGPATAAPTNPRPTGPDDDAVAIMPDPPGEGVDGHEICGKDVRELQRIGGEDGSASCLRLAAIASCKLRRIWSQICVIG